MQFSVFYGQNIDVDGQTLDFLKGLGQLCFSKGTFSGKNKIKGNLYVHGHFFFKDNIFIFSRETFWFPRGRKKNPGLGKFKHFLNNIQKVSTNHSDWLEIL